MAYNSQPWPAISGSPSYSDVAWKTMLRLFGNPGADGANVGVMLHGSEPLKVKAQSTPTLNVDVMAGEAMIKGLFAKSDSTVTLAVDAADPTYSRYDVVVFRSDSTTPGSVSIILKKGTAGPSPVPPALDQSGAPYYEIPLATITVGNGVTSITGGVIQDTRRFWNGGANKYAVFRVANQNNSAIERGQVVCLAAPYSGDNFGLRHPEVVKFGDFGSISTLLWYWPVGVAMEDAAKGAWVTVMTEGFYPFELNASGISAMTYAYPDRTNPKQVVLPLIFFFGSNFTSTMTPPIGIALQTATSALSKTGWVYVCPMAFWQPNLLFHRDFSGAGNETTASATFVDIAGFTATALTPQLPVQDSFHKYLVTLVAQVSHSVVNSTIEFGFTMNDGDVHSLWTEEMAVATRKYMVYAERIVLASPGTTFKFKWRTSAATATLYKDIGSTGVGFVSQTPHVTVRPLDMVIVG